MRQGQSVALTDRPQRACAPLIVGMKDDVKQYIAPPPLTASGALPPMAKSVVVGCDAVEPHTIYCRWWAGKFMRAVFPQAVIKIVAVDREKGVSKGGPMPDVLFMGSPEQWKEGLNLRNSAPMVTSNVVVENKRWYFSSSCRPFTSQASFSVTLKPQQYVCIYPHTFTPVHVCIPGKGAGWMGYTTTQKAKFARMPKSGHLLLR